MQDPSCDIIKAECVEVEALDLDSVDDDAVEILYTHDAVKDGGGASTSSTNGGVYMLDGNTSQLMGQPSGPPNRCSVMVMDREEGPDNWNEKETVVRFIDMVRRNPAIWDVACEAYRKKIMRKKTFRKIGEEMGWTSGDVLKKYNNLRTYYTREVIKQKRSGRESKWPYFEQLDVFLRRTVHKRQPAGSSIRSRWHVPYSRFARGANENYESVQSGGGARKRRLLPLNPGAPTPRSGPTRISSSSSVSQGGSILNTSLAMPISSSASAPSSNLMYIENVRSLAAIQQQQQPRQTTTTMVHAPEPSSRILQAPMIPAAPSMPALPSQQHNQQMQAIRDKAQGRTQLSRQNPTTSKPPATTSSSLDATPNATYSSTLVDRLPPAAALKSTESSDIIFGQLIVSQLSRIAEGRIKEELKISLMQLIVRSMFTDGQ